MVKKLLFRYQHQPDAPHGFYFDVCIRFEMFAKLVDKHIQAARGKEIVFRIPETAQDSFAAHHFVLVLGKQLQYLRFPLVST